MDKMVVVITGASSGAGRAAAMLFASHGADVVLAARNEDALEEVAVECRERGADVLAVPTDVSDFSRVSTLAQTAWNWKGTIDVWVNNAGVLAAGGFEETPMEIHRQVILTNLLGYMNGAHAVLPYFKRQGHGVIINNISIGAFLPVPYGVGYSASKFGLRGFSQALKGELNAWPDIHVCDLYPAFLHTPGILHAANYTGKVIKAAPPVYDPFEVARAMVKVAERPRPETYIGPVSRVFKLGYLAAPRLTTAVTGSVMRGYFGQAQDAEPTSGNVLGPVVHAMQVFGPEQEKRATRKVNIAFGALLGAGLAGLAWLLIKKD